MNTEIILKKVRESIFSFKATNLQYAEADSGGGAGGAHPLFLTIIFFFFSTIETCSTPNHLLFGRHLLYSSNTTSTVVRNLTVLSSTTDKINRISNHFLDRWRHEFT